MMYDMWNTSFINFTPPFKVKEVDIQMGTGLVTPKPRAEDQEFFHLGFVWEFEGWRIFFFLGTLRRRKYMEIQIVTDFLCDCGLEICDVEHFLW